MLLLLFYACLRNSKCLQHYCLFGQSYFLVCSRAPIPQSFPPPMHCYEDKWAYQKCRMFSKRQANLKAFRLGYDANSILYLKQTALTEGNSGKELKRAWKNGNASPVTMAMNMSSVWNTKWSPDNKKRLTTPGLVHTVNITGWTWNQEINTKLKLLLWHDGN